MTVLNESDFSADEIMLAVADGYEAPQGSDEWYEERLGKVTASRLDAVCRRTQAGKITAEYTKYMYQLLVERLTGKRPRFTSSAIEWGKEQEEAAAFRYEEVTGNIVHEVGFIQHETLKAGASADRLVGDDGIVELKCPNTATHLQYLANDALPITYFWQVHGQMWILDRAWNDFVSHDPELPDGVDLFIKRVPRDESVIALIEERVTEFLQLLDGTEQVLRSKITG